MYGREGGRRFFDVGRRFYERTLERCRIDRGRLAAVAETDNSHPSFAVRARFAVDDVGGVVVGRHSAGWATPTSTTTAVTSRTTRRASPPAVSHRQERRDDDDHEDYDHDDEDAHDDCHRRPTCRHRRYRETLFTKSNDTGLHLKNRYSGIRLPEKADAHQMASMLATFNNKSSEYATMNKCKLIF